MKCKDQRSKSKAGDAARRYPREQLRDLARERGATPAAADLAHYYLVTPDISGTPEMQQRLLRYERAVRAEFANVEREVSVIFTPIDPYGSVEEMAEDVQLNGRLEVFSGGTPISYLPHDVNVMARAVHDMRDHLPDLAFDLAGEIRAWQRAKKRLPDLAGLLFSEGVLQASTYEVFGHFVDAPQKIVPVTDDLIDLALSLTR